MKKGNVIILVILLLIGFALVSTSLVLNGRINLGFNSDNFESRIVYTRAETTDGTATINQDEKNIDFESIKLENINQKAILEFDVTNKSREYDANATISCGLKDNFASFSEYLNVSIDVENPFRLNSSETKTGHLTVEMIKPYVLDDTEVEASCELIATPVERDTLGDKYIYKDKVLNGADPVLKGELIPVKIANTGEVTYTDTSKEWYNYSNKEWANAVILVDTPSKEYKEKDVILESDIESYFVWIPKYSYKIQTLGVSTTESLFEIRFGLENTVDSSSECATPNKSGSSGNCSVGKYMTHPAFTSFGDINGLWVGKFDTTGNVNNITIKPNNPSIRNQILSAFFKLGYNYKRELDSHMMKNTEWGAVAYLTNSLYGRCNESSCEEVFINNNSSYLTGWSGMSVSAGSSTTSGYSYYNLNSANASTTKNHFGIYDISGGAEEFVAGVWGGLTYGSAGFNSNDLKLYQSKYYDVYSTSSNSHLTYTTRILGDATAETKGWNSDMSYFTLSSNPWFIREVTVDLGPQQVRFSLDIILDFRQVTMVFA